VLQSITPQQKNKTKQNNLFLIPYVIALAEMQYSKHKVINRMTTLVLTFVQLIESWFINLTYTKNSEIVANSLHWAQQ
jgi:hypothetical protein